VENGLPDNEVISVVQTHDGYLWIGTLHGLVRFDGNHFTIFNQANTPDLPGDRIVFLFEDSRTNLFVGTENAGLCKIKNGIVEKFPGDMDVMNADEDSAGNVCFNITMAKQIFIPAACDLLTARFKTGSAKRNLPERFRGTTCR